MASLLRPNGLGRYSLVGDNEIRFNTTGAQVLQATHASRWSPELLMRLPVVGVDGTMRHRLKTGPAAGLQWPMLRSREPLFGRVHQIRFSGLGVGWLGRRRICRPPSKALKSRHREGAES